MLGLASFGSELSFHTVSPGRSHQLLKMKMGGYYITFVSSPELGNAGVVLYSHPHSHLLHLDEISKFGPRRKFR